MCLLGADGDDTLVGGAGSDVIIADGQANGALLGGADTGLNGSTDEVTGGSRRLKYVIHLGSRGMTVSDSLGSRRTFPTFTKPWC